jgi:hypothetical protein
MGSPWVPRSSHMSPARRSLLEYEYTFRLHPARTLDELGEQLYLEGLAGCYLGRVPTQPGLWMVGVPCRDPDGEARLQAEVTALFQRLYSEAECLGATTDQPAHPGREWVLLNGPLDGIGNREYDAP